MSTIYYWIGFKQTGGGGEVLATQDTGNTHWFNWGTDNGGTSVVGIEPSTELGPGWADIEVPDANVNNLCQTAVGIQVVCSSSPTVTQENYLVRKTRSLGQNVDFTMGSTNSETGTFTPTSSSLLVLNLCLYSQEITEDAVAVTDSDAGTWTRIASQIERRDTGSTVMYLTETWVREVGTAAAMSVSIDAGYTVTINNINGINASLLSLTNYTGSAPFAEALEIADYDTAGAYTIDMSSLAVSALELLPVTNPVQNVAFAPPRTCSEKRLYCRV